MTKKIGKPAPLPKAKAHPVSPLAPKWPKDLPPIAGVRLATAAAGIKYSGRDDVLLAVFAPGTQAAGVLTRSKTSSAPVDLCRAGLKKGRGRALVVNSGNSNAFTGRAGLDAARLVAKSAARIVVASANEIFCASTGVIGEPLPAEKIIAVLPKAYRSGKPKGWLDAVRAIMTTDTFPKLASATARIGGARITINGIAKGSGMIAPDMATMLAFIFTDANLPHAVLQPILADIASRSFNAITVDGDTSTSDTLLLFATGVAKHEKISAPGDKRLAEFKDKLEEVARSLALQIVHDGEGARKLIQVTVTGAKSEQAARRIAFSIGNSPLVKTAIAGEDANWGRIVMAVGKAGEAANRDRLSIRFGPHRVAANGQRDRTYDEAKVSAYMKNSEIEIEADVGVGKARATIWTCDLTEGYIRINADYRS